MSKPERLLYSRKEAADMLGISPKTLLAEVRRGEIRYVLVGKRRKYTRQDLEEFIERKRIKWPFAGGRTVRSSSPIPRGRVLSFAEIYARETGKKRKRANRNSSPQ